MPIALRVFIFGLFWFAIFWGALTVVCGGIASSSTAGAPPVSTSVQPGGNVAERVNNYAAAADFNERYRVWIIAGAAVLAAAGSLPGILPGTRRK
jgi:hypothetical protein